VKRKTVYFVAATLIAVTAAFCLWSTRSSSTKKYEWGRSPLRTAERVYYSQKIQDILTTLAQIESRAAPGNASEAERIPFICLVVDTAKKEMWIESDGIVLPECRVELPPRMEWQVCRSTSNGAVQLPEISRFRAPRTCGNPPREQRFILVGWSRREEMTFDFTPSGPSGTGYASGFWIRRNRVGSSSGTVRRDPAGEPFFLADTDYEKAQKGFKASGSASSDCPVLSDKWLAWSRVEKRLYQEIYRKASDAGYHLTSLELQCGPDYAGAFAKVTARSPSVVPGITFYPRMAQAYLRIDSLGQDIWYAKSQRFSGLPNASYLDLEFLVSAQEEIPAQNVTALLQAGQDKQRRIAQPPPSRWHIDLPFGASFEFLGLCENPSAGRSWWGPDGSPLDEAPHVNDQAHPCSMEDHVVYEIAWRIRQSPSGQPRVTAYLLRAQSVPLIVPDHYGNSMPPEQSAQACVFDRTRTKVNIEVVARKDNESMTLATLENISLVPGVDPGFRIVLGGASGQ
jgi:hypothetical protein